MSELLLQLTDPHIGADWIDADPLDTLRTVVAAVRALPDRPVAALVTGDLANDGRSEQYARLAPVLAELELPVHVLPGNHDDRAALRAQFDPPGSGGEPIQYAVELDGLRVLMLDTLCPGEGFGELGPERLEWIAAALAVAPDAPTLLAMHHPPFRPGLPGMDGDALAVADREALAGLVQAHPQVCGVVAGHVHRTMLTAVGGRPALSVPSTYCQLPFDATAPVLRPVPEPLAFAVHCLVDGRLISHVVTLEDTAAS